MSTVRVTEDPVDREPSKRPPPAASSGGTRRRPRRCCTRSRREVADRRPQPGLVDLDVLVAAAREGGLDVELVVSGEPVELEPGVGLTAYRLVQEALENAARHAGLARVRVALTWRGPALHVHVEGSP